MTEYAEKWMTVAFQTAKQGWVKSRPNPSVGAVVVKDGLELGRAHSQAGGGPHAEATVLAALGEKAKGADLFVTLEPCSHFGKNPPCTLAILSAGIKRVFVALFDSNPLVSGLDFLREKGVEVIDSILPEVALAMYDPFFHYIKTGKTRVVVKIAETQNGVVAKEGAPLRITGEKANQFTGFLRGRAHGILVTTKTALTDNPRLNLHSDISGWVNSPEPIFFGRTKPQLPHLNCEEGDRRVRYSLHQGANRIENFKELVKELSAEGYHELFVEPGADFGQELVKSGEWDHLHLYRNEKMQEEGVQWRDPTDNSFEIPGELVKFEALGTESHFFYQKFP